MHVCAEIAVIVVTHNTELEQDNRQRQAVCFSNIMQVVEAANEVNHSNKTSYTSASYSIFCFLLSAPRKQQEKLYVIATCGVGFESCKRKVHFLELNTIL